MENQGTKGLHCWETFLKHHKEHPDITEAKTVPKKEHTSKIYIAIFLLSKALVRQVL